MSPSEKVNHDDLALRIARLKRGTLALVIDDEVEEGAGEF